jgi:malonyl CoA-acyl carrier protein transacylase
MRIAHMFPGQGSQRIGMGKILFSMYPEYCQLADQVLGYSIEELCTVDSNRRLNETKYTQPAIFFVSCLEYMYLKSKNEIVPDFLFGHSLGLYAALFASKVFDIKTGLEIVSKRAELMHEFSNGGMLAVIGNEVGEIPNLLVQYGFTDIDIANYNTRNQIVLSGKKDSIIKCKTILEGINYSCIILPVSGPFHSRYMESARIAFFEFIMSYKFQTPEIPIISTTNAEVVSLPFLLEELSFQLIKPVRWFQTIEYLKKKYQNIEFIEIGETNILTNLNHKILANI